MSTVSIKPAELTKHVITAELANLKAMRCVYRFLQMLKTYEITRELTSEVSQVIFSFLLGSDSIAYYQNVDLVSHNANDFMLTNMSTTKIDDWAFQLFSSVITETVNNLQLILDGEPSGQDLMVWEDLVGAGFKFQSRPADSIIQATVLMGSVIIGQRLLKDFPCTIHVIRHEIHYCSKADIHAVIDRFHLLGDHEFVTKSLLCC